MKLRQLPGGDLEYAALAAVWDLGEATAREVHGRVGVPSGLAYTTTATVLDRLHAKKLLTRRRAGRAFVYAPAALRETVERARARVFLARLFGDAPEPALAALVEAVESIDPQLLDQLATVVALRRKSRRGS